MTKQDLVTENELLKVLIIDAYYNALASNTMMMRHIHLTYNSSYDANTRFIKDSKVNIIVGGE